MALFQPRLSPQEETNIGTSAWPISIFMFGSCLYTFRYAY